jgi:RPA family protein
MTKRWTAYKMAIADIVNGNYTDDGFVQFRNLQVNRVRIIGTVVSKFVADDRKYGFFIVDDGTETIRVRSFEDNLPLIEKVKIGDIVDVIGRIRKYEDEIYIIPESVQIIDNPNWIILRKLELMRQKKELPKTEDHVESNEEEIVLEEVEEEIVIENPEDKKLPEGQTTLVESPRQKVVKLIKELDKGEGAEVSKIIEKVGDENTVETVLTDLMNEGEIFEPRPGKVKLLE